MKKRSLLSLFAASSLLCLSAFAYSASPFYSVDGSTEEEPLVPQAKVEEKKEEKNSHSQWNSIINAINTKSENLSADKMSTPAEGEGSAQAKIDESELTPLLEEFLLEVQEDKEIVESNLPRESDISLPVSTLLEETLQELESTPTSEAPSKEVAKKNTSETAAEREAEALVGQTTEKAKATTETSSTSVATQGLTPDHSENMDYSLPLPPSVENLLSGMEDDPENATGTSQNVHVSTESFEEAEKNVAESLPWSTISLSEIPTDEDGADPTIMEPSFLPFVTTDGEFADPTLTPPLQIDSDAMSVSVEEEEMEETPFLPPLLTEFNSESREVAEAELKKNSEILKENGRDLNTAEKLLAEMEPFDTTTPASYEVKTEPVEPATDAPTNTIVVDSATKPTFKVLDDLALVPVLTPSLANRKTEKLRLANGMKVLIISDPHAERSGAALAVEAGSWDDPSHRQGMAHFVEHMLFLGTSKYPTEGEFKDYLVDNTGSANAYTSDDHTVYFFDVKNSAFDGALDRFSWMFIDPLFNESGVDREVKAIEQEFAKSIENEFVRAHYVHKAIGNKMHPSNQFNFGNSISLKAVDRKELVKWYEQHYSSHLMQLVVVSPKPLDQLRDMVVSNFEPVAERGYAKRNVPLSSVRTSENKGTLVKIKPLKDIRTLSLEWELSPEFAHNVDTKPEDIIAFVIGHEGENSLLAQLKREQLAEGLSAGGEKRGTNNFLFHVKVQLTEKGLRDIDRVITRTYQAIAGMKREGAPQHLFNDIELIDLAKYQYQSREDTYLTVMNHAEGLMNEDISTYPEKTFLHTRFDPEGVTKMLTELTPENCMYTLIAKPEIAQFSPDSREVWFGAEYTTEKLSDAQMERWTSALPHPDIKLPGTNPFIPENLTLVNDPVLNKKFSAPFPTQVLNNSKGKLYFATDRNYYVPEVAWEFVIKTNTPPTVRNAVLKDIFVKSVVEKLNTVSYNAHVAGLDYSVGVKAPQGITVTVRGYSDKADVLLQEILSTMKNLRITRDQFDMYKDSLMISYKNRKKDSPLQQSSEILRNILHRHYASPQEKASVVEDVNFDHFQDFSQTLFARTYVEGLLYGNMVQSDSDKVWRMIEHTLGSRAFDPDDHVKKEVLVLPKGPFYIVKKTPSLGNAVILMAQNGTFSFKRRAAQQLLATAVEEPFYTALRTKQQTGYIVWNWERELERQLYSFFAIQSSTHNVRDLLARFELFLEGFLQELENSNVPEAEFEKLKASLIAKLEENPENLQNMASYLATIAFDYNGDFNWMPKRIEGAKQLRYSEFISMAREYIGRANKKRLAIMMKGTLPKENEFRYFHVNNPSKLREISDYVTRQENLSSGVSNKMDWNREVGGLERSQNSY